MRCPSCERENQADARFCSGCGVPLCVVCAQCGRANDDDARFCNGCGAKLAANQVRSSAPRDYTPHHLAESILTQRAALEGERKLVTVLFADVKGSMEIAGQVDPEAWHQILDGFFAILTEGVHRFEGTVNQYTGDGIMAIFGAPISHEDHAQRACWAAVQMKGRLREFSRDVLRRYGISFSTRTGLHSGEVVVGKIGDDLRMDYTAQGHTVGLAARMESLAAPNAVYLTGRTAALVEGYFDLESLGDFEIKGVEDPVAVHELLGVGEARTRFDLSLARGLSKFVGREADVATLEAAFDTARVGTGQVVGVVGEAGVGKSRLCFEFAESCRLKGYRVYRGSAVSHGGNLPAHPMMQVFHDYFGMSPEDEPRVTREKLTGRIVLLAPELLESLPLAFEFFGVADPERPLPPMDPGVQQRRTAELLSRLVQSEETTISLVEDLHWFDAASESLLADWVDAIAGASSLLILNFRPGYQAAWMQRSNYHQIGLAALDRASILELLGDLLGDHPSLGNLPALIAGRTAGSPFFTEEVVRELVERGALTGARGAYSAASRVDSIDVPQTVQPLLAARIDRLGESEKQVLQAASVVGAEFDEELLAATLGRSPAALRDPLARLKESEFVYESALFPRIEYSFRHPLTREVAYDSQLTEARRSLHRAVADALESMRRDTEPALLAHHREAAGQVLAAAEAYCAAADATQATKAIDALGWFRKVRDLVLDLDDPAATSLHKRALLGIFIAAGWRQGMAAEEIPELYAEGIRLGEADGDDSFLAAFIISYTPTVGILKADLNDYYAHAAEAERRAAASGDIDLQIAAASIRYYSSLLTGRDSEAAAAAQAMIDLAGDDHWAGMRFFRLSGAAFGRLARSTYLAAAGDFSGAFRDLREAEAIAREIGSKDDLCFTLNSYVFAAQYLGSPGDGEAKVRSSISIAEAECGPHVQVLCLDTLGRSLSLCGDWRGARDAYDRASELVASSGTGREHAAGVLAARGRCAFELGDLGEARRLVDQALTLSLSQGATVHHDEARRVHALVLAAEGEPAAGATELEILPAAAEIFPCERLLLLWDRTRLQEMAGWTDRARETLAEIVRISRSVEADGHVAAAEARLAALETAASPVR